MLGPGQLAARLDALHADPSFTSGALDTEPIGREVHRIGDLEVVAGQGRPHRRQLRHPRVGVRLGGAGPRLQRRLRPRRRPAPLIRPGDTLLSEVSFGPGPVPPGVLHLDGPAVGRLASVDAASAACS